MAHHQAFVRQPSSRDGKERVSGPAVGDTGPHVGGASPLLVLALQRKIGNDAVVRMLRSQSEGAGGAEVDGSVPQAGPAAAAPVVRRVILVKDEEVPGTWGKLMKKYASDKTTLAEIQDVFDKAKMEVGDGVDVKKLKASWGKIAKNPNHTFNLADDRLPAAIAKSYKRSADSSKVFGKRKQDYHKVGAGLKTKGFQIKDNARNPTAEKRKLDTFDFDTAMHPAKKEQRHIATVLLHNYGKGVESQASFKKDRSALHISTNVNSVNKQMRKKIKGRTGIKNEARVMLTGKGAATMSREDAMKDREVRHPLKLLLRLNKFLSASGIVEVPPEVTPYLDGRHAEIRIKQGGSWSQEYFHPPSGTRYPCMGCALHFWSDGVKIGTEMGPMWLTDASLSTQLEGELLKGKKLGTLDDTKAVSDKILAQFSTVENVVKQGMGKPRTGAPSDDRDADSESDLDEDEYKRALKLIDESDSESETIEQPRKKARHVEPEKPADSASEDETGDADFEAEDEVFV